MTEARNRAVEVTRFGGPEGLEVVKLPCRQPAGARCGSACSPRLFGLLGNLRHPAARCRADLPSMRSPRAHRRLEAGGLEGKLVLCPDIPSRRDRMHA